MTFSSIPKIRCGKEVTVKRIFVAAALLGAALGRADAKDLDAPADDGLRRVVEEQNRRIEELARELEEMRKGTPPVRGEPAVAKPPEKGGGSWTDRIRLGLFYVESADKANRLEFQVRLHLDWRGELDAGRDDVQNGFQVRRARLTLAGHVLGQDRVTYKLGLEFGRTSGANLRDAYAGLRIVDELQLRVGQQLLPFSTERLTTSNVMVHLERPIVIGNVVDQRETGFMLHGKFLDGLTRYYVGAFNGAGQNVRGNDDDDVELAARVEVEPVKGLTFAGSYVYTPANRGNHGPTDVHTVGNEMMLFLDWDSKNLRFGSRQRATLDARLFLGPLLLKGELVLDRHERMFSTRGHRADLLVTSYFLDAAWVFLGDRDEEKVKPWHVLYDEETKEWGAGAFELAGRFEHWQVEREAITKGFAKGTDEVYSGTATLHWYPWQKLRFSASYTYSAFDDRVALANRKAERDEHALVARMTLFF